MILKYERLASPKSKKKLQTEKLAGEINTYMPNYVIQKIGEALNTIQKSINNSKILLLGLSYKKNIDDLRESPSLELLHQLTIKGADIYYSDPFFNKIPRTRKYQFDLSSQKINTKILKNVDLVVLATDHDDFDYSLIEKEAKLIVDTRGKFKNSEKIVRA